MTHISKPDLNSALAERYSDAPDTGIVAEPLLQLMASRGSCRTFEATPVPDHLLQMLCAIALASPTKSDLQQRDIIVMKSPGVRSELAKLVSGQAWVAQAPTLLVFCGNNRRQRLLHTWHDVPFANDHMDAVINPTADAAIALGAFVTAAEAMGLGCCPISAVRNEAQAVSDLLGLPDHVFPFAGLALGYPSEAPEIAKRLPLSVTCHMDRYQEDGLRDAVKNYDADRAKVQPYATQRFVEFFGQAEAYGWSDDKVRQYSQSERADFGAYLRKQGFCVD
ncbi:NADPH-dependent oxidoreductase [Tateyamaria omphalii]|uniref:nitroreductase family protein n=1 Tax=Tateyamaria omphalii TaxID=299262 RepID=UPI00167639FE|nr:nitroreductase family protein [Tateyamaria omphalii]GGX39018.1 NADPH-dependent oxidoreductase [Tateyamaria omphalii]